MIGLIHDNLINYWDRLSNKYRWLPYPRQPYYYGKYVRRANPLVERLLCPWLKHEWRFNSGNGVFCTRCGYYARKRDLNEV